MGKKISLVTMLLFALSVLGVSTASGEEMEYKEYIVVQGDTLWNISGKEVEDPFLWPKIWKENPEIKNPDRIYPSQTIRIPLRLLVKEQPEDAVVEKAAAVTPEPSAQIEPKVEEPVKPAEKQIAAMPMHYLADSDLLLSAGYITDYIAKEIKSVGKIVGSPTGRTLLGKDDYAYIKTAAPSNTGDKFYIIRSTAVIKHPVTKNKLGHFIEVLGVAEIIGSENSATKAKIIKSFDDILVGDLLDSYYEVEPILPDDNPRKPDIAGVVIAVRNTKTIAGSMDIIFIDKGASNGLETGDLVKTVSIDKHHKSRMNGAVQIISLKPSTAAALVKNSESTISAGDRIEQLK